MYESALAKALFHLSMSEGLIVPEKWGAAAGEATTAAAAADTIFGFDLLVPKFLGVRFPGDWAYL